MRHTRESLPGGGRLVASRVALVPVALRVACVLAVTAVALGGCAGRGWAERRDAGSASSPGVAPAAASVTAGAQAQAGAGVVRSSAGGTIDPAVVAGIEAAIAGADRVAASGESSAAQDG